MNQEHRKNVRIPSRIVTTLHTPDSVVTKVGCMTDLSLEGMCFETEAEIGRGTDIYLTFNLPVEVQGRVVYISKKGPLKQYGVKFTALGEVDRLSVEKFVTARFKK
jgi:hypothetical protein